MHDFFRDAGGNDSMVRLILFLAFFPATVMMLYLHTETAFGLYLTAVFLNMMNSKWAERDVAITNTQINSDCSGDISDDSVSVESGSVAQQSKSVGRSKKRTI